MGKYILGSLISGLFLVGGVLAGYSVYTQLPSALQAKDWPTVDGVVTKSSLRRPKSKKTRHSFEYEYKVGTISFTNQRIAFMDRVFYASPEKNAAKYPEGSAVVVFYKPTDPSVSVLDTEVGWIGFATASIVAAFFTVIGLFGFRAAFR